VRAVSSDFEFLAVSFKCPGSLVHRVVNVPVHLLLFTFSMYSACLSFSPGHEKGAKKAG
jgi:hypothetical protein